MLSTSVEHKVPPLRFAPVGMTRLFRKIISLSRGSRRRHRRRFPSLAKRARFHPSPCHRHPHLENREMWGTRFSFFPGLAQLS